MKRKLLLVFCLASAAVLFALVWPHFWVRIHPGYAGVVNRAFAPDEPFVIPEGVHCVAPWNETTLYDLRFQPLKIPATAVTKDGVQIQTTFSLRHLPNRRLLLHLHQNVGPEYIRRFLVPKVQAIANQILGQHSAEEIYVSQRGEIVEAIKKELRRTSQQWIVIEDFCLKAIDLPQPLREAFEGAAIEQQKKEALKARLIRELGETVAAPAEAAPSSGKKEFEFKAKGDMGGLNLPTLDELVPRPADLSGQK